MRSLRITGVVVVAVVTLVVLAVVTRPSHHPSGSAHRAVARTVVSPRVVRRDPSGVAMPRGDEPGWTLVAADDFDGSRLDTAAWQEYLGPARSDHAGYFDPTHLHVGGGMLVESTFRDPKRGDRWTSAGVKSWRSQTYGRYEVRMRFTGGEGIAHDLLLWPSDNRALPQIDFSDDNGSRSAKVNDGVLRYGGGADRTVSVRVDLRHWHTFGVIWTPRELRYTLDGRVWATQTGRAVPHLPMRMAIQAQALSCNGKGAICPGPATPRVVDLDVAWAVQYAYTPGRA